MVATAAAELVVSGLLVEVGPQEGEGRHCGQDVQESALDGYSGCGDCQNDLRALNVGPV